MCSQADAPRRDVGQIHPFLIENEETRLCENHLGGRAVYIEFSDEDTPGIPYVCSFPTCRKHVAICVKLDAVRDARIGVSKDTTVRERLGLIDVILVAVAGKVNKS